MSIYHDRRQGPEVGVYDERDQLVGRYWLLATAEDELWNATTADGRSSAHRSAAAARAAIVAYANARATE